MWLDRLTQTGRFGSLQLALSPFPLRRALPLRPCRGVFPCSSSLVLPPTPPPSTFFPIHCAAYPGSILSVGITPLDIPRVHCNRAGTARCACNEAHRPAIAPRWLVMAAGIVDRASGLLYRVLGKGFGDLNASRGTRGRAFFELDGLRFVFGYLGFWVFEMKIKKIIVSCLLCILMLNWFRSR